jgi:hypothetical protein
MYVCTQNDWLWIRRPVEECRREPRRVCTQVFAKDHYLKTIILYAKMFKFGYIISMETFFYFGFLPLRQN